MRNSMFQRPRWHLVPLMFLTSAATATTISIGDASLSLSNFQLITELSVPLGCLLAYNNPIQGCEAIDFDSTRTCSARCTRGLTRMQNTLQDACQAVQVQVNTLLGQALAGNLVNLLCGATNQPTSSPVQTIKPGTTTVFVLPSTSAVKPPPPPPSPSTTSIIPPPPSPTSVIPPPPPPPPPPTTTSTTAIPTPTQPPPPPPPSTTAVPPAATPAPPPPPPPTTIVTSTTTTENQPAPQSTSSKPPVNPLDALLMNGAQSRTTGCVLMWSLPALVVIVSGVI